MAPRSIFVMVAGLSPQIVTETLYAFAQAAPESLHDAEVHLITTQEGARRAELTLLTPPEAQFTQLLAEYSLPAVRLSSQHLHVITDADGQSLNDIRTPADNAAAADFITHKIRDFTRDPHTVLHVSLAGGRKTMGFYIGYALSLYGREQDTLSHVLVSECFESHPAFFFPTRQSRIIYTRDGKPLDTRHAAVTLARIPFVRLRDELPEEALVQHLSFNKAVALLNAATQPASVTVSTHRPRVWCHAIEIRLEPMEWVLYLWFATRCLENKPALAPPVEGFPDTTQGKALLEVIQRFDLEDQLMTRSLTALETGLDLNTFRARRSALHRKLKQHLGQRLAKRIMITHSRQQGGYALPLSPAQVTLTGE